jgi:hypothetical protein
VLALVAGGVVVGVRALLAERGRDRCWSNIPNRTLGAAPHRLLLLVDLNSNTSARADTIAQDLEQSVHSALTGESNITMLVDPGANGDIVLSPCLDATHIFRFNAYRDNAESLRRAEVATESAVMTHIRDFILRVSVSRTGSPLRLLQRAYEASRVSASGYAGSEFVLWSDFLSNAHDCLDIGRGFATSVAAESVEKRCAASGSLPRLPGSLTIFGLESGGRDDLLPWTREVAVRICRRVTKDCRGA